MTSEAARLRYPYPDEAPGTLRAQRKALRNLGQLLLDSHGDVNDDVLLTSESWRSDAATKAMGDTRDLARLMGRDSTAVGDVLGAMATYIGKIEEARTLIDGIRTRYDEAADDRTAASRDVPEWADNRWLRHEYRDGVQAAYQRSVTQLDTEYSGVGSDLADQARPTVAALRAATELLAPHAPAGMSLGQVAYQDAAGDFDLVGDSPYEYALREAGLLDGPSPDGYYAQWLQNAEANGVDVETILQIAREHDIGPEDFEVLDGLEEVTDPDGKSFFVLPADISADDARLAVLMTYILNAGTGYGDNPETDLDAEPYDAAEVRRVIARQESNDWSYDEDVPFVHGNGGRLATTPNGMLMGLGGNWLQDQYSVNGGTTWGDIFMLNIDEPDDAVQVLREAVASGEAYYQFDDGSIGVGANHLDLDRLLHHEERHSQQWAALGRPLFISDYLTAAAWEKLPFTGPNVFEEHAGLTDGGYE